MVWRNPAYIHSPLASIPSLKFHYFKASKPSLQAIQLDYGSNPSSWTFNSKHPLHFSRDVLLLNNPLSNTPHLRIPKWYLTLRLFFSKIYKWFHKILIQNFRLKWYKKTMIEWYTNNIQVLEQWCTQKHSPNAQMYSRKIYEG